MITTADLPALPAIVRGTVRHAREEALSHRFAHRAHLWLVDVDALPDHGVLARFDVADHLGDPQKSLRENVVHFVASQEGDDMAVGIERIVMLAAARVAGYVFDPLSVFWCFAADGRLRCVVAEVHNTYGERHAYVLRPDAQGRAETDKEFYVSPFFDVSGRYTMTFALTNESVDVSVELYRGSSEHAAFRASFAGTAVPATRRALLRTSLAQPLMPQRVTALIRWHGIGLWLRRLPIVPRPRHQAPEGVEPPARPAWDAIGSPPRRPFGRRVAASLVSYACRAAHVPQDALKLSPSVYDRLAAHPKIGLADGWIVGEWDVREGYDLADILTLFAARLERTLPPWAWRLRRLTDTALPSHARNDRRGSRANIEAHYDLSNDLFAHFLDETMTYSSGLYEGREFSLQQAQERKLDAVLDLAEVGVGTRLLEIGTGWGSLALRAAQRGAEVVSVTLSEEQREHALGVVREAGMAGRVDVRLQDYRDVEGSFDSIVSIEMVEAVGEEFWPDYLRAVEARLAPEGIAAIQAITMSHERMLATRHSHGWIQRYIFPGGLIPSVEALADVARRETDLELTRARAFGADYAKTLREWRRRFLDAWPTIRELGFTNNFRRMWELYLAYSEAGFASGYLDVEHLVLRHHPSTDDSPRSTP